MYISGKSLYKGKNMKIKDLEKVFFDDIAGASLEDLRENQKIMRKYFDNMKLQTIKKATDALVKTAIKNGVVFNAVCKIEPTPQNIGLKKSVYRQYMDFIGNINALPVIEKEYVMIKFEDKMKALKKQYYLEVAKGFFDEAKAYKMQVLALNTTLLSLKGQNKKFEIVREH